MIENCYVRQIKKKIIDYSNYNQRIERFFLMYNSPVFMYFPRRNLSHQIHGWRRVSVYKFRREVVNSRN